MSNGIEIIGQDEEGVHFTDSGVTCLQYCTGGTRKGRRHNLFVPELIFWAEAKARRWSLTMIENSDMYPLQCLEMVVRKYMVEDNFLISVITSAQVAFIPNA